MSEERMRQFKNHGKDSQELRRRRNDAMVELRKSRKDEQLIKRRNIELQEPLLDNPFINGNGLITNGNGHGINGINSKNGSMEIMQLGNGGQDCPEGLLQKEAPASYINSITMNRITSDILSGDEKKEFVGCQITRKILSREKHPPIDPIIMSGIVPKCIQLLRSPNLDTRFEAAWIITNIASGTPEQTSYIIENGAVDPLVEMLKSSQLFLVEQAVWALGNIAGDGPHNRDMLIEKGIVQPLLGLVKATQSASFLRNIAWTFSNLCRSKSPSPPLSAIKQILPALARLIKFEDTEIISDACWALSYLSDGSNEKIEEVVKAGVIPRVIELLNSNDLSVVTPCLRTVGNIVTGNDSQTDRVLRSGEVVRMLGKLLKHSKPNIAKEAAWALSNITAGTASQINEVLEANIFPSLIHIIQNGELRVQREAVWTITNITSGGSMEHIALICKLGAIPALCAMLKCKDWKTVSVAMDGLENILKGAAQVGELDKVQLTIEESGGLDMLETLQAHENNGLYTKAFTIVDTYFNTTETMT